MMGGTEERYSRAVRSSSLKMKDNAPGDVDTLTAAGMSDSLGTRLLRLRTEFDSIHRAQIVAQANYSTAMRAIETKQKDSERSKELRKTAEREALTARLLILIELKSLSPAKQTLGQYALRMNEFRGLELEVPEIERIVGAVLDAWLDRKCHKCDGRGFTGGYDGPAIRCRTCRETGNRRHGLFSDKLAGQSMAEKMIASMDRAVDAAERRMRGLLR